MLLCYMWSHLSERAHVLDRGAVLDGLAPVEGRLLVAVGRGVHRGHATLGQLARQGHWARLLEGPRREGKDLRVT